VVLSGLSAGGEGGEEAVGGFGQLELGLRDTFGSGNADDLDVMGMTSQGEG